jgi:hypothetical protein
LNAVKKFQETDTDINGIQLAIDGKVGKLTAKALNRAAGI